MEINEMTLSEVEARVAEMNQQMEAAEAPIEGFEEEMRSLLERKAELAEIEQRKKDAEALTNGEAQPEKIIETVMVEEKRTMDRNSVEYRDAFYALLTGKATAEQRGFFADSATGSYGDGISLPVALDTQVWDQVATAHPIISDVARLNSGIAIKVTKLTPAAISKKKDSATSAEETYTSAEVTLVGADYHTYITLSYAEAKMSQGAMETYLVNDIATVIGEALAADIFARILSDATTSQKVDKTKYTDAFSQAKAALALAKTANNPVIYAPADVYYDLVGAINAAGGNPYNVGTVLGCTIKKDNAATCMTVVDPSMFILNVVSDINVKTQDDVKEAAFVIGGYCRAEGCLRKTTAAAYVG